MELNKELKKLKVHLDDGLENEFRKQSDYIHANFISEEDRKIIDIFISTELSELSLQTDELIRKAQSLLVCEPIHL
jgi:hypothetical protein